MVMMWSWCHCECFISFHVIGKSHVNVIWCHMMAFNRICPGHCKLRKTHKWWHASDFFLHFRTGCFGVLRLSNDINSCWHDFYSIYRFVPRKLRGFVPWFYHWRHQLRTKQRDYINTYYHTSHTQKKICWTNQYVVFCPTKKQKSDIFTGWQLLQDFVQLLEMARLNKAICLWRRVDGRAPWWVHRETVRIASSRTRWRTFFRPSFNHSHLSTWQRQKMGGKTDGIFLWYIWYVLNFEAKGDGCDTGRHFNRVTWSSSIYYSIWWQSVAKYGRSAEVRSPTKE